MKRYVEPKTLANPNKPKSAKDAGSRKTRYPAVITGQAPVVEIRGTRKEGGYMKGDIYVSKGFGGTSKAQREVEKTAARWVDHQFLFKRRVTNPSDWPEHIGPHAMDAIEDIRTSYLLDQQPIDYHIPTGTKLEGFLGDCGFVELGKVQSPSDDKTVSEDERAQRFAQETAAILLGLKYINSPLRDTVNAWMDHNWQLRVNTIVRTIDAKMSESDLSFEDAIFLAELLEQMISELPLPEEALSPVIEMKQEEGCVKVKSTKPGGDWSDGVEAEKESGLKGDDSIDWSKAHTRGRTVKAPKYKVPNFISQVQKRWGNYFSSGKAQGKYFDYVPKASTYGYGRYGGGYSDGYAGFTPYKPLGKGASVKGNERITPWGKMKIDLPRLTHTTLKPRDAGRNYRHVARDSGRTLRYMSRYSTDGRIFGQKRHKRGGIALLIDTSGSMPLSSSDIDNILRKIPASIIACYSGSGQEGQLRVVAKDGRRVAPHLCDSGSGGMNVVDFPALQWLALQANTGKYWLSDGGVTGCYDSTGAGNNQQCHDICVQEDIYRVNSVTDLLNVIFEGEELGPLGLIRTHDEDEEHA